MKRVQLFDSTSPSDLRDYEIVLNNPLCTILEKEFVTKKEKYFSEDGIPTHATEIPYILVHWEEKEI